jgi:hypothetical protein
MPGMTAENDFPSSSVPTPIFELLTSIAARFYIYSVIEYDDPGNPSKSTRTTKSCAFWSANKNPALFLNCPEYNDAN